MCACSIEHPADTRTNSIKPLDATDSPKLHRGRGCSHDLTPEPLLTVACSPRSRAARPRTTGPAETDAGVDSGTPAAQRGEAPAELGCSYKRRAGQPVERSRAGGGRGGILDSVHEHLATLRTTADAGRTLPSYGPAWDAAIDFGIDVTLLEHNLALSPSERLQQLDEMLRLYFSVAR
jgi:hypothetical protein